MHVPGGTARRTHLAEGHLEAKRDESRGEEADSFEAVPASFSPHEFLNDRLVVYFRRALEKNGEVLERYGQRVVVADIVEQGERSLGRTTDIEVSDPLEILCELFVVQRRDRRWWSVS